METVDSTNDQAHTVAAMLDTTFDFRTEVSNWQKRDPDTHSPTLRRYHKLLWSKALPNGRIFDLDDSGNKSSSYLRHRSDLGDFVLNSDGALATYTRWRRMKSILASCPAAENDEFQRLGYTIGSMMVFPGKPIDGMTINQIRGIDTKIRDRLDLTLECIRRHYQREWSPLASHLHRYEAFFALFEDFEGYIDFFMLQDLVTDGAVNFWLPLDFKSDALPRDCYEYRTYRGHAMAFVKARNRRIGSDPRICQAGTRAPSEMADARIAGLRRADVYHGTQIGLPIN